MSNIHKDLLQINKSEIDGSKQKMYERIGLPFHKVRYINGQQMKMLNLIIQQGNAI